jgi:hypothetical protein
MSVSHDWASTKHQQGKKREVSEGPKVLNVEKSDKTIKSPPYWNKTTIWKNTSQFEGVRSEMKKRSMKLLSDFSYLTC